MIVLLTRIAKLRKFLVTLKKNGVNCDSPEYDILKNFFDSLQNNHLQGNPDYVGFSDLQYDCFQNNINEEGFNIKLNKFLKKLSDQYSFHHKGDDPGTFRGEFDKFIDTL